MRVDDLASVEHGRVLVDRRQTRIRERGENRGMNRVDMHDTACVRHVAMNRPVQTPGGRVRRVGPLHRFGIVRVDQEKVARLDARKMHEVRIDQDLSPALVEGEREVVGDGFVHVEPRRPAKGGGEVAALLVEGQVRAVCIGKLGDAHRVLS
jgi:hypothetical protein